MEGLYYKLTGTKVRPATREEGIAQFDNPNRQVAEDFIGHTRISTVFLVLNHAMSGQPLLFETMVFGGALDEEQVRYHTYDEAVAGHAQMVARVKEASTTPSAPEAAGGGEGE